MVGTAIRRGGSGQATIENVGLTLVVALLLGALAMWAVRTQWAPDSPPAVLDRVTAALVAAPLPAGPVGAATVGSRRQMEREAAAAGGGGDAADADRRGVLARAWDGFLWWGALNVDGQIEAGKGFLEQVGVRAEDLVKDPVKTIEGAVGRLSEPPLTGSAARVANIVKTITTMGDRPFRESFLGISRDLGGLGADWLIARYARGAGDLLGRLLPG